MWITFRTDYILLILQILTFSVKYNPREISQNYYLRNLIRLKKIQKYLENKNTKQKVDNNDIRDFSCAFSPLNNKTKQCNM